MKISTTTKTAKTIVSDDPTAKVQPIEEKPPVQSETPVVAEESPIVEEEPKVEAPVETPAETPAAAPTAEVKEEVKEETMPIVPVKAKTAPIVNKKEEAPVSIELKFMREYVSSYKEMITSHMPDASKCGEALVRILKYAAAKQHSTEVLDELYAFFNEMKTSFLAPHKALSGVASLNKVTRDRVQIIYMLMYELVRGSKGPFDFEYAAKVLGGAGFVTYISTRLKK